VRGWEHQADAWAEWARSHDDGWAEALELLPPAGRATLDVGCGEGRHCRALAAGGHHVVGVDASPTLVRLAGEAEPALEFAVADAVDLPFDDGAFDLVLAHNVLSCVGDLPGAVDEAARVLEPLGRLVLTIPHPLYTAGARDGDAWRVDRYLAERPHEDRVAAAGLAFANVHRPIGAYVGALAEAGLRVETLREPGSPLPVPLFLHLRAVKT
jgi:SAM-dependent methyltransferase